MEALSRQVQEEIWRNQHYLLQKPKLINAENSGHVFLQILQNIQGKLKTKMEFEETEISFFNINICSKLIDFKEKLYHIWSLLPTNSDNLPALQIRSPENGFVVPYPISSKNRKHLSD